VIGPTSHNYNSNQNTVTGSAHIVNSNTNIKVLSGFNVIFHQLVCARRCYRYSSVRRTFLIHHVDAPYLDI